MAQISKIASELRSFYSELRQLSESLSVVVTNPANRGPPEPHPDDFEPVPPQLAGFLEIGNDGSVGLRASLKTVEDSTKLSAAVITYEQDRLEQDTLQWYVSKANALDNQAAAALSKLMPETPSTPVNLSEAGTFTEGLGLTVVSGAAMTGAVGEALAAGGALAVGTVGAVALGAGVVAFGVGDFFYNLSEGRSFLQSLAAPENTIDHATVSAGHEVEHLWDDVFRL